MQICPAYQLSGLSVLICIKLIKLYKNEIIQKIWAKRESGLTTVRLKRDPPVQAFQPHKLPILTSQAKCHYKLSNPINCQFWHHSCVWLKELPQYMVSHPYLIFRNKWDIKQFLFLLTFSYHWEILYEPHCQQCWVKFTHAGHVILQLILLQVMKQNGATSFSTP